MSILIKNGTIANSESVFQADLFIDGETIAAIGKDLDLEAEKVQIAEKLSEQVDSYLEYVAEEWMKENELEK